MKASCKVMEVGGIIAALEGMRLPTKSKGDSICGVLGEKDKKLAKTLLNKGNVHGKFQRGIIAWLDINMPRYIWSEMDTYTKGVEPISSESTMYTLLKEVKAGDRLHKYFIDGVEEEVVLYFEDYAARVVGDESLTNTEKILKLKQGLPEGFMQRRIKAYGYQALKGIYKYRKMHRLPEWKAVCDCIEKLPYFEELLLGCSKEEFEVE
ncbi:MAG: hypothetical protein GY941_22040 [Planctomycetes bacterium]|nr:hypothetical protein [Planctomycetota bacterium]